MATAVKSGPLTPADELRDLLTRSEHRVVAPAGPGDMAELFGWLDRLTELWPGLEASGVDLRAEQGRWQSLQGAIQRRAGQLLQAWGGKGPLAQARQASAPDRSRWWWWIDELVAQGRQQRLRKWAVGLAAAVVVVVLSAFLLSRLFPVDPRVRETYRLQSEAETALMNGDLQTARDNFQRAVAISPDDELLQISDGVLADMLGDPTAAEQSWATARSLLQGDEAQFLTLRGRAYLQANDLARAIQDEQAALAIDPSLPLAHLTLGTAYELSNEFQKAFDSYTKAAELAGDADPQISVLAKTRIAAVLQRMQIDTMSTAVP